MPLDVETRLGSEDLLNDLGKPPTAAEMRSWFPAELPDPAPGVFELGLALGGTVSAGAYTAGALDLLVEALDEWCLAKRRNEPVPPHRVSLKILAGASGGGACSAILARALPFDFPHVRADTPAETASRNPLFDVWVNRLTFEALTATGDLAGPADGEWSILNTGPIDQAARTILEFGAGQAPHPFGTGARPWVAEPLPVVVTLSNMQGVPYELSFEQSKYEYFIRKSDYARFDCDISVEQDFRFSKSYRPDVFQVKKSDPASLKQFAEYGAGTGAFPLVFRPRLLTRPAIHYRYRVAVVPPEERGGDKQQWVVPMRPAWSRLLGLVDAKGEYRFRATDGGMFNNEPVEIARTHLAGLCGRNKRDQRFANRAVLLLDPLISDGVVQPDGAGKLSDRIGLVLGALVQEARYRTADLMLMTDETVFSRFLLSPTRTCRRRDDGIPRIGDDALSGSGVGAFLGFVHRDFRMHDYLLGRSNTWKFLRQEFALHRDNPVFHDWGDLKNDPKFQSPDDPEYLTLIPLVGSVQDPEPEPDWPVGRVRKSELDDAENQLSTRMKGVIKKIKDENAEEFGSFGIILSLLRSCGADGIASSFRKSAEAALKDLEL